MYNVFQNRVETEQRSTSTKRLKQQHVRLLRESTKREALRMTSELRRMDWTQRQLSPVLAKSRSQTALLQGTVQLLHPSQMRYRSPGAGGVYVRRYSPGSTRAAEAQADFQSGHLSPLPALRKNPLAPSSLPTKLSDRVLRTRATINQGRLVQTEAADTYRVLFPQFRASPSPSKWKGNTDFRRHGKQFGADAVWTTPRQYAPEPYTEPMKTIQRETDRDKDTAGEFIAVSPSDVWIKSIHTQESLRKGEADQLFSHLAPRSDISKASTSVASMKLYKNSVESYLHAKADYLQLNKSVVI